MDSRGQWHDGDSKFMSQFPDREGRMPEREMPVIEIGIGEKVEIVAADGQIQSATFKKAEKNQVTLVPDYQGKPGVYLEFGSTVELRNEKLISVKATVWDNRNGNIVLRTLPL